MNLFLIRRQDPSIDEYAWYSHLGTWREYRCANCGSLRADLVPPFLVEWERGSTRLGDFSWCGYQPLVTSPVRAFFESAVGDGVSFFEPQYVPSKFKRKVIRPTEIEPVWWMVNSNFAALDEKASQLVEREDSCELCLAYKFKIGGLILPSAQTRKAPCFRISQFAPSLALFCTETFANLLREQKFSNYRLELAGEIV